MSKQNSEHLDVIVVGAGQAGLSAGYYLNKQKLKYAIFEGGSIAESWKSQRWDSLHVDSPDMVNLLPGESKGDVRDDWFSSAKEFREKLRNYTLINQLPVKEYYQVISLDRSEDTGLFTVKTSHDGNIELWTAGKVIIASGMLNVPKIPSISKDLPAGIMQLHSSAYRNPAQMPEGNILVVGSGRSGSSIAEDLILAGRKVYLATSKVGRLPRRYRGRDITSWGAALGRLNQRTKDITDPEVFKEPLPVVASIARKGQTLSLQMLHKGGVSLFGRLLGYGEGKLHFGNDVVENIYYADQLSANTKTMIDGFIAQHGLDLPEAEFDEADVPDPKGESAETDTVLDFAGSGINSVIWATGLTGNFDWVQLPIADDNGNLIHDEGISSVKGLFYLGMPWLRSRKSGVIPGLSEDAEYITDRLIEQ